MDKIPGLVKLCSSADLDSRWQSKYRKMKNKTYFSQSKLFLCQLIPLKPHWILIQVSTFWTFFGKRNWQTSFSCTLYFIRIHIRVHCTRSGFIYVYTGLGPDSYLCTLYWIRIHICVHCTRFGFIFVDTGWVRIHIRVHCTGSGFIFVYTVLDPDSYSCTLY